MNHRDACAREINQIAKEKACNIVNFYLKTKRLYSIELSIPFFCDEK